MAYKRMGFALSGLCRCLGRARRYGTLVMFGHTVFSLSFAALSLLCASAGRPRFGTLFWAGLAFLSARTGANALNRAVDAQIDGRNPRTAGRQIPRGEVTSGETLALSAVCFLLLIFSAGMLNPVCLLLSPLALLLMSGYSYTKRFTWLCHLVLGVTCACAPVGAWLAVTGRFALRPLLLGAANCLWTAGFDILYGTQDYEFDLAHGLYSIPVRFGLRRALQISAAFHLLALLALLAFGLLEARMGPLFWMGFAGIAALMALQHRMVTPDRRDKAQLASYNVSQLTSLLLLFCGVLDVYL